MLLVGTHVESIKPKQLAEIQARIDKEIAENFNPKIYHLRGPYFVSSATGKGVSDLWDEVLALVSNPSLFPNVPSYYEYILNLLLAEAKKNGRHRFFDEQDDTFGLVPLDRALNIASPPNPQRTENALLFHHNQGNLVLNRGSRYSTAPLIPQLYSWQRLRCNETPTVVKITLRRLVSQKPWMDT